MLPSNANRSSQGFTLIENLIIVIIVGIIAAISVPSFLSLYNGGKVKDALNQVQTNLQQSQVQAIRTRLKASDTITCTVTIDSVNNQVTSSCSTPTSINADVALASNLTSIPFTYRGTTFLSDTGAIVFFEKDNPTSANKKCLLVYSPMGIIRNGVYTGTLPPNSTNIIDPTKCK